MKKKGFTLIELLAVIVILAVIALITIPIILGVIKTAEKNAFKNSVYGIYDAIDYYYATNLNETDLAKEFNFSKTVPLKYKGEKMVSGKITIDEKGNKIVSFVTNGKYCANGTNNDIEVSDDCISLDETKAEIDESKIRTTSTTNSITVILGEGFAVDEESGIKEYEYIKKKGNEEENSKPTKDTTYVFEGLTHNTEYEITIKVTNNNNKVTEVVTDVRTLTVEQPIIVLEGTPEKLQNGYLKKQVATITYEKEDGEQNVTESIYYVKTSRAGTGSISGTPCGTATTPGECSGTATTSYTANTWYKVNGNVSVTYSEASDNTGTIYAVVGDGINLSVMSTGTIDKIDTASPNVELGSPTVTSNSITIPITSSDSESGLGEATCKYSNESGNYTKNANSVSTTSCNLTDLEENKTYYYQVCIKDKVGNESPCKTGSVLLPVTLTFNGNGGTNGSGITKLSGETIGTLPNSTRSGYKFAGWYTAATGGNKISSSTIVPTSNVTYYAQWQKLVTGISLNKTSFVMLNNKSTTATITATVSPSDAYNKNLTWTSSDPSVATVNNGVVTALKSGKVTITATSQDGSNIKSTCEIIVAGVPEGSGVVRYAMSNNIVTNDLREAVAGTWIGTTVFNDRDETTSYNYSNYSGAMYIAFPTARRIKNIYVTHITNNSNWNINLYNQAGIRMKNWIIGTGQITYTLGNIADQSVTAVYLEFESVNNVWWFAPQEIYFEFYDY